MSDASDLVAHARDTRVVVVGAGPAGLVAALEFAKVGMTVTILEARAGVGGALRSVDIDGVAADVVVDAFAGGDPALTALLTELGLAERVVAAPVRTAWITGLSGRDGAAPLPAGALLGIPANPWDDAVRRIIGWGGAWRAYLDRLRPPLTIGHERSLGALVARRMGDRVRDRLVAPITRGRFGLDPEQVDVDGVAPGLNTALTRVGSLAGAVAAGAGAPAERLTIDGGVAALTAALIDRLDVLGVEVRTGARATGLHRRGEGWRVATADADPTATEPPAVEADVVVVAADEPGARDLLRGVVSAPAAAAQEVDAVILRVRMPDTGRGDVFPVAGPARRITDLTDVAAGLGTGERLLRVVLDAGDAPDAAGAVEEAALAAVAAAHGIPLTSSEVRAAVATRLSWAPETPLVDDVELVAFREAVARVPGLAVAGSWAVRGGLSETVADAVAEAGRIRHRVLWGDGAHEARP